MGMFSWNCKVCGLDMMSDNSGFYDGVYIRSVPEWMKYVVIFMYERPKIPILGKYDGYGKVDGKDIRPVCLFTGNCGSFCRAHDPCCYHRQCWDLAGRPSYTGPSIPSPTQGFGDAGFFTLDEEEDPMVKNPCPVPPPSEWKNFRLLWACVSINEFFYRIDAIYRTQKHKEQLNSLLNKVNKKLERDTNNE